MPLTPKGIVDELNKYIIGQDDAKRAVAIALRNRHRRSLLPEEIRTEITPKNIIMSGPTGVGKTEIARRISHLMKAPFIKVEATKFTEVGYVGRDVESMVRDLVEASIRMIKKERLTFVEDQAKYQAEQRIVDIFAGTATTQPQQSPFNLIFGTPQLNPAAKETPEQQQARMTKRQEIEYKLRSGVLEDTVIEIEVEDNSTLGIEIGGIGGDINVGEMFSGIMPKKMKKRKVPVSEARKIFAQEEADKLIDMDDVISCAIERAEQDGIIFLDEIDKIAGKTMGAGHDISREGVQRDILPIVEGSTVVTKYGPVKTDYMLFIAAGAFHTAKISDLIPELQGRFPIHVELKPLTKADFIKILSQPENAITKQYAALLSTEGINISFGDDALSAIAEFAQEANSTMENIGARRLHTIMENLLDDISFNASDVFPPVDIKIDEAYVREHMKDYLKERKLERFIL